MIKQNIWEACHNSSPSGMDRLCFKFRQQQRLATYSTHKAGGPGVLLSPTSKDQKPRSLSPTTRLTTWLTHNSAFWSDWGVVSPFSMNSPRKLGLLEAGGAGNVGGGAKSKGLGTLHLPVAGGGTLLDSNPQHPKSLPSKDRD